MSLGQSTNIVTNGLIFYYDMNNRKSFTGPTITNLAQTINTAGIGTGTGYVATEGTEVVNIPQIGPMTVKYVNIQNNYSTSNNCCPSLFQYGGWNVSPSTLYTYGIVYKCDSGYTGPNFMYRYEYNSGSYVTELGVHDTNKRIYLGDGWWWAWNTTTTASSTNRINSSGLWYYQYSSFSDKISVAKILFAQGDWSGLHPKYWPSVNTTRSTTQALVDLTGNNTITANSLTYNSDGTFDFNYANQSTLTIPLSTAFNKTVGTMNFWVYPTRYNGGNGYFVNYTDSTPNFTDWFWIGPYSNTFYFRLGNGSDCCSNDLSFGNVSSVIPLNTWTNMCFTWSINGTSSIYKNGELYTSRSIGNVPSTNPASTGRIGLGHSNADSYFNGKMGNVSIYNRVLSADEVKQNFNALRGRYGI